MQFPPPQRRTTCKRLASSLVNVVFCEIPCTVWLGLLLLWHTIRGIAGCPTHARSHFLGDPDAGSISLSDEGMEPLDDNDLSTPRGLGNPGMTPVTHVTVTVLQ